MSYLKIKDYNLEKAYFYLFLYMAEKLESLTLRRELTLRVFENEVLRDDARRRQRKLNNGVLYSYTPHLIYLG
jgi:hypothetical protein